MKIDGDCKEETLPGTHRMIRKNEDKVKQCTLTACALTFRRDSYRNSRETYHRHKKYKKNNFIHSVLLARKVLLYSERKNTC